jgi:hypothetical protein
VFNPAKTARDGALAALLQSVISGSAETPASPEAPADAHDLAPAQAGAEPAPQGNALVPNETVSQSVGSRTGKFIDNTTDPLTKNEKQVVDDLVRQGRTVERIPKDPNSINKSPDFTVDGVKTELKSLQNPNTTTGVGRVQQGFKQGAETVIIDARGSGLTPQQAQEIIDRAAGTYPNKVLPGKVEIWTDERVITGL